MRYNIYESVNTTLDSFKQNIETINQVFDSLINSPNTPETTLNAFTSEGINRLNEVVTYTKNVVNLKLLTEAQREKIKPKAEDVNLIASNTIVRMLNAKPKTK